MSEKAVKRTTVERVAELAMKLGGKHLADYGSARSRHDFTQRQLMACLILRAYLKTTYRGVLELLAVSPNLRAALGMDSKLILVSERSKPASKERMKTSHFEERIAFGVVQTAQRRDESTQRELAAFNNDFGGAWLVPPAHCA